MDKLCRQRLLTLNLHSHRYIDIADHTTLWIPLPEDVRSTECMKTFKAHLKTFYFKIAFNV